MKAFLIEHSINLLILMKSYALSIEHSIDLVFSWLSYKTILKIEILHYTDKNLQKILYLFYKLVNTGTRK